MVAVSRLLCGLTAPGDPLRFAGEDTRPVVVWNITRTCNLRCAHCYASSENVRYPGELTTSQATAVIDDLAAFGVPVILFSGGEPLLREDLFELASHAAGKGVRCVLSTNGTLIDGSLAQRIQSAGFAYVGVSIDGMGRAHDKIRGQQGSFDAAIEGLRHCREAGLRTGLRFTMHRLNVDQLPAIFELIDQEDISRLCIYHLAYSGRGGRMARHDLLPEETRAAADYIFAQARSLPRREILTVDNHADAAHLYLTLASQDQQRALEVYRLLRRNGGNRSGIAISCIDNLGDVHPDQFSWHQSLGNVLQRSFSETWQDGSNSVLSVLRDRKPLLKGRCGACRFLEICNGNLRARAYAATGDWLASDPACYLTDSEIGL